LTYEVKIFYFNTIWVEITSDFTLDLAPTGTDKIDIRISNEDEDE
jgi:hypothetical protein